MVLNGQTCGWYEFYTALEIIRKKANNASETQEIHETAKISESKGYQVVDGNIPDLQTGGQRGRGTVASSL